MPGSTATPRKKKKENKEKKKEHKAKKQKKESAKSKYLFEIPEEQVEDSDTIVGDLSTAEMSLVQNIDEGSDQFSSTLNSAAANTNKGDSPIEKPSAAATAMLQNVAIKTAANLIGDAVAATQSSSIADTSHAEARHEQPLKRRTGAAKSKKVFAVSTPAEEVIIEDYPDTDEFDGESDECEGAIGYNNASAIIRDLRSGAVPKAKVAQNVSHDYEFPKKPESWFEQTENASRVEPTVKKATVQTGQRTKIPYIPRSETLTRKAVSVYFPQQSAEKDVACQVPPEAKNKVTYDNLLTQNARQIAEADAKRAHAHGLAKTSTLAPQQQPSLNYNDPPRLVVDTRMQSLHGDCAYFQDGEYRQPDRRTIFIESLERMYQNTLTASFLEQPRVAIEYQLKSAEKDWDHFLAEHNIIYNTCTSREEIEHHRLIHRTTQRVNESLLNRLLNRISQFDEETRERTNRSFANNTLNERGIRNEIKLDRISIEKFDGQYQKWPQFKKIFETYFHNADLSSAAKMVHLLSHLKQDSEPYNLISGLNPTGENYEIAWQTICGAYNDDRRILDALITSFVDIPPVTTPNRSNLMNLVTRTKNLIEPMATYNIATDTWGIWVVPLLVRKLDTNSRREWCMDRPRRVKPEIQPLLDFITLRADGVEEAERNENRNYTNDANNRRFSSQNQSNNAYKKSAHDSTNSTNPHGGNRADEQKKKAPRVFKCPDPLCVAPNNGHDLYYCPRFTSLELENRKHKVRVLSVCELCLLKGHSTAQCKRKRCTTCDERHNSWLCPRNIRPPIIAPTAHVAVKNSAVATADELIHSPLLATAVVTLIDRYGKKHQLRALCDPGSQLNMITTDAYQKCGNAKTRDSVEISGIACSQASSDGQTSIGFKSRFEHGTQFYVTAMVMSKITTKLPAVQFATEGWKHLDDLPLADPQYNVPGDIDLLFGAATCAEIMKSGLRRGENGQPIAQCTKIGWIIYGSTHVTSRYLQTLHVAIESAIGKSEPSIHQLLTKFWELEDAPVRRLRTPEQQLCEDSFVANTKRDESGRYVVRIPIKADAPSLGLSRKVALTRFFQMETRFAKNPELHMQYSNFMKEYLMLGHMIEAPPLPNGVQHFYIPHHAAGTKKFRVVFDGSSKTANGIAFNDVQLNGEKLQPELTDITMRFRVNRVALTADIKKMYRQVLIPADQRDLQRILWREKPSGPIKDYQLVTQTYGLRSAPHSCVRALIQCANDHEDHYKNASEVTRRDFYVDDLLTGADTEENAAKLHGELTEMLAKGGFELAKWTTNAVALHAIVHASSDAKLIPLNLDVSEEEESSVLGLKWSPTKDVFRYKITAPSQSEKRTKRTIVSNVAKLYDPNGYLAPVITTAKVIIQKLWEAKIEWDAKVPEGVDKEWKSFVAELPRLEEVAIPRWIKTTPQSTNELHAFSDASKIAYGCAFYIKSTSRENGSSVQLVAAKTRVAPLKKSALVTIPRLELCGANLMAKMLLGIREVHHISPEKCCLWTDSTIVLQWLRNPPTSAKIYVANRVAETIELTKGSTWHHVPTKDNPADMASRGIAPSKIANEQLWWHGPTWLNQPHEQWPTIDLSLTVAQRKAMAEEMSPPVVLLARPTDEAPLLKNENGDLLDQFDKLHRLIRVTAYVIRFIENSRARLERLAYTRGPLTAEELINAEMKWIQRDQRKHFATEMQQLENSRTLPSNSKIAELRPFVEDGLLRSSSRLVNAKLPRNAVQPFILSSKSKLTQLVIKRAHEKLLHGATQQTMHYVRQMFWVPKLRSVTRTVIHRCVKCVRFIGQPMEQQMAPLPAVRVTPGRAFERSGVDYCGPYYIKARSGRCRTICKAYIAVFVCVATRAIHLEVVSDMTTNAFIAALTRFTARRGRVHELLSDNGKNFEGADNELASTIRSWRKLPRDDMFNALQIKWTFIPPLTPHQGGLWEAAVKSTKHHLRRIVGNQQLTFEELATVLAEVEACLNSRPICRLTDDASDNLALTPGHFLVGEPIITPLARDHTSVPTNRLQRWKLLQRFSQDFWQRWKEEYLDQLAVRSKWQNIRTNAAIDDVVLVRSENTPPTQWPMGRVTNTYMGSDGLVRSVDVTYGGHTYQRPITKLVLLPTSDMES